MSDKKKEQVEDIEKMDEHAENEPTATEKNDLFKQWCPEDRVVYDE